jgi:DNA-binding NarL/FixJ family response regulator
MNFTLLVVDDSDAIRTRLCSLLQSIPGITAIEQASTLGEVLACVRRSPPTMVVLDLHLPDGLGMDVIGSLKHIAPKLLVAVLTLYGQRSYREKCLALGADWFFDKASEFDTLLDVVRQQIAQQTISQTKQEVHHALH